MNDKTIAALSREYAEFTNMSPVDKKNISAICECFLKFVLRRYCLVEKGIERGGITHDPDCPCREKGGER